MQVIFSNYFIDWLWVFEDIYQEIIDLQEETRIGFSVLIKARLKTLHTNCHQSAAPFNWISHFSGIEQYKSLLCK